MSKPTASAVLTQAKTKAFLVSNLTNIRYLTGVEVSAGLVLIKGKKSVLYVDGRYTEVAQNTAVTGVEVAPIERFEVDMKRVSQCGFESDDVTVARFSNWKRKLKNTKFVQKRGVIEEFRRSKSPEELKHFKKAQRITKKIMQRIPKLLKFGVTEQAIAETIRQWAVELGAQELSFDPIVAFGKNSAHPHHHPGKTKLKKRDIVQIDCGARVNGYCADQSTVFFVGKPTEEMKRVYQAVEQAQAAATKALKAGVTNVKLDKVARTVLKGHGLEEYFVHSLGHGVGLDIHEGTTLSAKAKPVKLLKNEIVTIEPGVYLPGKFGIRLEREVIVA